MLLEKIDGNKTSYEIAKLIGNEIGSLEIEEIHNLFLAFIQREELNKIVDISINPIKNRLKLCCVECGL